MLKRNVVANYAGTAWSAVAGVVFVPLYIRYLGDEAYGIIGICAVIQGYLTFFDGGLTPMLSREMARYTGGAHEAEAIRSLLRTVELCAWLVALLAMSAIWLGARWIAVDWLKSEALAPEEIAHAIRIMALVVGLRFIEGMYRGCLIGLQRQVASSVITAADATLRGVGAIAILALWSPTLEAFFWWQGAVSLLSTSVLIACAYSALPRSSVSLRLGVRTLRAAWPFAGGMLLSSLLVLGLTQTDKLLLSRLLDLADYGRYTLALLVASCVAMAAGPIQQAFYPRLTELHARGDHVGFTQAFHHAAQLVSVVASSIGVTLFVFAGEILLLWTRDPELASSITMPVRLLVAGSLVNAFMTTPYFCQLATGWTSISNGINGFAILVVVPALFVVVPRYGMTGAAAVFAVLNAFYLVIGAPLSFRRLLTSEMSRWYLVDLALPLGAGICAAAVVRLVIQFIAPDAAWQSALGIMAGGLAATGAAVLAAPLVRASALRLLSRQH
jgi:O-antigen/teichoic acid export membrane protein